MRIADRHIEWDARSVLTWQYDKAVNMIAFLSIWQKWIDVNCNQLFYGCKTQMVNRENYSEKGYGQLKANFFMDEDHESVKDVKTTESLKAFLIPISQEWKNSDSRKEQEDQKNGTTRIKDEGRDMVNHIGDTFKMRVRKLYEYSVASDGSLEKTWVNCEDDTSYEVREKTAEFSPKSVMKSVACGSTSTFSGYWYESEYEYTYVTWNGEQWVECPKYNHDYAGGWFADIFAIDTCNEFGLHLWAKLIGVELPTIYGIDSDKRCEQTDEQNEIWRTYIKARFYRLLTNASMHDIIEYLHHVFAQFDHEVIVEDGGSYELGTVNGSSFTEAVNTVTDDSGESRSGPVCSIVTVNPNDDRHKGWSITDKSLDTFRDSDTIIKEGYRVEVSRPDAMSEWRDMTVSETGTDCITVTHDGTGVRTVLNKVKVRLLGEWTEGCEIVSVSGDTMTVRDADGNEKTTLSDASVYNSTLKEWEDGYNVIAVNGDWTVKVMMPGGGEADVSQSDVRVRFFGDWEEGYSVDELLSATRIVVVDSEGNKSKTENSVCVYVDETGDYDEGYSVFGVDHEGFVVKDASGASEYTASKYVRMVPYKDIEYFGVELMTISYSCEFDYTAIERAILSISDFLPHPSAVIAANKILVTGEDTSFGLNSHNFNETCLPTVVKDADGNKFYVYPYQDLEESDCDVPKKLKKLKERDTNKTYIEEKYGNGVTKGLLETLRDGGSVGRWDDIFVCYEVGVDGKKGTAWWAVGTEWDCHVEDSDKTEVDPEKAFTGQTTLYKYANDGTVVTATSKTPVIYDEYLGDDKTLRLNGYIRKVEKIGGKWHYYDGRYDPANVVSSKWKPLGEDVDDVTGEVIGVYYKYKPNPTDVTESATYYVEFDEDGEPKYANKEFRCYANHEEAQNAVCRIESYEADNGDMTPLLTSSNQNIANLQTVTLGVDFMPRGLVFRTLFLDKMEWREFNLFGRNEIDSKNGGYFNGGMESPPIGLTEVANIVMGVSKDNVPRKFELWHKSYVQRQGVMMENAPSMKPYSETRSGEDKYYHKSEFDKNGKYVYVAPGSLKESDRLVTTSYKGLKIKYDRPDRNRRTKDDGHWKEGPTHIVDELFKLEDGKDYALAPKSGTYIVDFVYESETIGGVEERVFKGVRFLKKLIDGQSDDDTSLPWDKRLAKYADLTNEDVSDVVHEMPSGAKVSSTNRVLMPTCDYGFVKFNFRNVDISEVVEHPYHLYYYGFGKKKDGGNTFGDEAIPYKEDDETYEHFMAEIALVEIWGQNNLETLNFGGLSAK